MGASIREQGVADSSNNTTLLISVVLILIASINTVAVAWLSRWDSTRKLKNIRYILDVEENLFQAPSDPDHFNIALKKAEEFLKAERVFFWMQNSDSVQQRWWSSGKKERLTHGAQCEVIFPALLQRLASKGAIICQKAEADNTPPEVRAFCQELQTSSVIMIAVKRRNGSLKSILGAVSLTGRWKNAKPLEQIMDHCLFCLGDAVPPGLWRHGGAGDPALSAGG